MNDVIMKSLISFLIYTNLFVAFSALSLYKVTEILFGFKDQNLSFFVFFGTLFAYNYMRLPIFFSDKKEIKRLVWLHKYKYLTYIILLSSFVSIIFLFSLLGWNFIRLTIPALVISVFYPLSFSINNKTYRLRSIPFLKIFLIGFVWAYITLLLPLLYHSFPIDYTLLDFFFQRFLFLVAISIPFDMRDISFDDIKTLPNTIGVYESKIFAWFCLLLVDILLIIDVINNVITIPIFIALFLSIEASSIVIYFSNQKRDITFYGIIVEGLSIIMCLFVLLGSMI